MVIKIHQQVKNKDYAFSVVYTVLVVMKNSSEGEICLYILMIYH